MSAARNRIQVAVGIMVNQSHQVLIAKRQPHQHMAQCWEFPGGKIEQGESETAALKRELFEEVGIVVLAHEPWLDIIHDYQDKPVCLKVHKVLTFSGQPHGKEGQEICWVAPARLTDLPFPPANKIIIQKLIAEDPSITL